MPGFDASELQVIPQDDGSVTMNGMLKFTKDYGSPTRVRKKYLKNFKEFQVKLTDEDVQQTTSARRMEAWHGFT